MMKTYINCEPFLVLVGLWQIVRIVDSTLVVNTPGYGLSMFIDKIIVNCFKNYRDFGR